MYIAYSMYAFERDNLEVKQCTPCPLTSSRHDEKPSTVPIFVLCLLVDVKEIKYCRMRSPSLPEPAKATGASRVNIDLPGSCAPCLLNKLADAAWCFCQALHIIKLLILLNAPALRLPAVLISSRLAAIRAPFICCLDVWLTWTCGWIPSFSWSSGGSSSLTNSTLMWNSTATMRATFSRISCSCWMPNKHTHTDTHWCLYTQCTTLPDLVLCVLLSWHH